MKDELQEIYINLDDSGKLTSKEKICVYAGLVFVSKNEKDKFITQYKSIINEIKCAYCQHKKCDKKCPEIKNTNIKPSHKRRIMNYIKKYFILALIINNENVYDHIKIDKRAKGRFIDYSIKMLIKDVIQKLITSKIIDPNNPVKIIINIDEQSTKSNGYYDLKESIYEELKHGIINYNYSKKFDPIISADLEIKLSYQDSLKSYVVQAADLLAGTIRRVRVQNPTSNIKEILKYVNHVTLIPKEKSHKVTSSS